VQQDAVCWFQAFVQQHCPAAELKAESFHLLLSKLLLLVKPSTLANLLAPMPPEQAKLHVALLRREMPLLEEALTRLLLIALMDTRLTAGQALTMTETLTRRAALLAASSPTYHDALVVSETRVLEVVLQTSLYRPPEGVAAGVPLALSSLFWRGCAQIVLVAAHNPGTLRLKAWEHVPILRNLLQMVLTGTWCFPPFPDESTTRMLAHRRGEERARILEVENAVLL
jgi:hypothetical protein